LLNGAEEADLARSVIRQSGRIVMVADHLKFGQKAPLIVCPPQSVDCVVTDQPLAAGFSKSFADWDIELVQPEMEEMPC
jgi:DeoR family transcriptional regulator, glycerol-3-phosphate regulon repressor